MLEASPKCGGELNLIAASTKFKSKSEKIL